MLHYIPDSDIEYFIHEDALYGDLTTHLLGIGGKPLLKYGFEIQ